MSGDENNEHLKIDEIDFQAGVGFVACSNEDVEANVRASQRTRVPTIKGKEFQNELLRRIYMKAVRSWQRQANKAEAKCSSRKDDLTTSYANLVVFVDSSDRQNYEALCSTHQRILQKLNNKISKLNDDQSSRVSSKKSRRSRTSGKSADTTSSAALLKSERLAKAVRLTSELKFLDIEAERTASSKRQENELKGLQIRKELAVTQAEIEAVTMVENQTCLNLENLSKIVEDGLSSRVEQYLKSQRYDNPYKGFWSVNEDKASCSIERERSEETHPNSDEPIKSHSRSYTTPKLKEDSIHEDPISKLAVMLALRQDHYSLLRPPPEVFSGDFLQYPNWIKSFEAFIEGKTKSSTERHYYLGKFTTGEAKAASSCLLSLNTEEVYDEAKKSLTSRFGNIFMVANAYRRKIESWPNITPNDDPGLLRLSYYLQYCETAMNHIKYLNVLNDSEENQRILNKLPAHIVNR